jgi:hypothetical protein
MNNHLIHSNTFDIPMQIAMHNNATGNICKMYTFYVYINTSVHFKDSLNLFYAGYTSLSIEHQRQAYEYNARYSKQIGYNSKLSYQLRQCKFKYKVKNILHNYCSSKDAMIIYTYCVYYLQLRQCKLINDKVMVKPAIASVLTSLQIEILHASIDALLMVT